jgi:acetyl esterase/lipase
MNTIKYFLVLLLYVSFFESCQKNTGEVVQSLPAQTMPDVSYGSDPSQKMDIYLPAGRSADTTKIIILVHGGAWSTGDKTDFNQFVPDLQQRLKGYAIANINYRLATTVANHFPVQEQDMKAAVDFLMQKRSAYLFSDKLVLLGASSGGHQVTLQAYKYAQPSIRAVVDFFAPVDMTAMYNDAAPGSPNRLAIQVLVGGTPASSPTLYQQSSPIQFVSATSPPTIILHGSSDAIVNPAQSVALKARLDSAGVPNQLVIYPNQGHNIWPADIMHDAFDKIEAFIKANVH